MIDIIAIVIFRLLRVGRKFTWNLPKIQILISIVITKAVFRALNVSIGHNKTFRIGS